MQSAAYLFEKLKEQDINLFGSFNSFKVLVYKLRDEKYPKIKQFSDLLKVPISKLFLYFFLNFFF